jgi:hypothetical protein
MNQNKRLFAYDFDSTLVTDMGPKMWVVKITGEKIPIGQTDYQNEIYKLKPGEYIDSSEYTDVEDPVLHLDILESLKSNLSESCILTARTEASPVRRFMNKLGIYVPVIAAVGIHNKHHDSVKLNAHRKKSWLDQEISKTRITYLEVWDDNLTNLIVIKTLTEKYPELTINVNLVDHKVEGK